MTASHPSETNPYKLKINNSSGISHVENQQKIPSQLWHSRFIFQKEKKKKLRDSIREKFRFLGQIKIAL